MTSFESLPQVRYEGPQSTNPLAYRHYDAKERVLGKTMEQHLRLAVCYWHTFVWPGNDVFGQGTFARPWHVQGDELTLARRKADAAFGLISRLGVPFYTFHDTDVAPEGASLADYRSNLSAMVDVLAQKQQLQCYRATLSLAVVRQLDRPGIVSLHGDRQRIGYALLTGLGADTATLQVDGVARSVPLAVLARAWRGEFATLWKSPPGFPAKASEAAAGPLVDWLNAQLQPPRVGNDSSADLKSRVYAFQVAQGLRPDGIAGPTTFMQLNRALGVAEPHLKPAMQP